MNEVDVSTLEISPNPIPGPSDPNSIPGPSDDHTFANNTGHYFYIEVSGVAKGAKAQIISPLYQQTSRVCKMQFYYWMQGNDVGTLL